MRKLTETQVKRLPAAKSGTEKVWDSEIKGLVLFVGKRPKTWYFQKAIGGQTKRALIGRYPVISAAAARQTALGFALRWGRGAGKKVQIGAPTLQAAMETLFDVRHCRLCDFGGKADRSYQSATRLRRQFFNRDATMAEALGANI